MKDEFSLLFSRLAAEEGTVKKPFHDRRKQNDGDNQQDRTTPDQPNLV